MVNKAVILIVLSFVFLSSLVVAEFGYNNIETAAAPVNFTSINVNDSTFWDGHAYGDEGHWEINGSEIFYNAGNVGIGTSDPSEQLEITGNLEIPTTSSSVGQIKQNGNVIFHTYGTDNIFMGKSVGDFTLTGERNFAFGDTIMTGLTSGNDNIAMGDFAAWRITSGSNNVILGGSAGSSINTGSNNFALGTNALNAVTTGGDNVMIGTSAGVGITTDGARNVGIGTSSTRNVGNTLYNVGVGYKALEGAAGSNSNNVGIGSMAGEEVTTGDNNVFIGHQAGNSVTTGSNNVLLGYDVDTPTATTSNHLNIADAIFGDISTGNIEIINNLTVNDTLLVNEIESISGDLYLQPNANNNITIGRNLAINERPKLRVCGDRSNTEMCSTIHANEGGLGTIFGNTIGARFKFRNDDTGDDFEFITSAFTSQIITSGNAVRYTTSQADTSMTFEIRGLGTGIGRMKMFDNAGTYLDLQGNQGMGFIGTAGTAPGKIQMQRNAHAGVTFFDQATDGETQEVIIRGFFSGDARRGLEIGVGVDAADTASFDGVSNYLFDGNIDASGGEVKALLGNFTNITIGDPYNIYEEDGVLKIANGTDGLLRVLGSINVTGEINSDGNASFEDVIVRSEGSLHIGGRNFATISASNTTVANRSRIGVAIDRDLGVRVILNGSGILGVVNLNSDSLANSITTTLNALGHGIAKIKFSPNYMYPEIAYLVNNFGEMAITTRNDGGNNLTIGFFDDVLRDSLQNVLEIVNNTHVINIENSNAPDKFRTTFNYNVSHKGFVSIDKDLDVTGNFTGNQYYGEMSFDSNSTITTTINAFDTWENITGFNLSDNNGFIVSGDSLIVIVGGKYNSQYSVSMEDGANTEFNFAVAIDDSIQTNTKSHRKVGTATDVGNSGGIGFIRIEPGDAITLMVKNVDNAGDIDIHHATLNLIRIGD